MPSAPRPAISSRAGVEDYTSATMATINYGMQDLGDRYSFAPQTPFKTQNAIVTLDQETRRLTIRPKRMPRLQQFGNGVSQQIFGGYIVLPKKADATAAPVVHHEGPVGQKLRVEVPKLAEFCTTAR